MKIRSITAVSVLALMMALPAHAADVAATAGSGGAAVSATAPKDNSALGHVKSGLNRADTEMRDTADEIKAFFMGKGPDGKLEPVLIRRDRTAHGLIGEPIVNLKGEKIATVKDIILSNDGKAILVVVADGGVLGIGSKVAAFDYSKVVSQNPDGKVVMRLSQEMVDHAVDFSYDPKDWAKAKVIPARSISTNLLLEGEVVDSNGKKIADIENVYFRDAEASQLIVGFDKTFGFGGELAALDYDKLQMVHKNKEVDFKLTASQTAQFWNFKKSVAN
jgi:uncharacterized protein YrrD